MEVKLQCRIGKLKMEHGDIVKVGDKHIEEEQISQELADRLLAKGLALTAEGAKAQSKANEEAEAKQAAKDAEKAEAEAKVAKAKSAEKKAAEKSKNYDILTKAQLKAEAKELGVEVDSKANKDEILVAVKAHVGL